MEKDTKFMFRINSDLKKAVTKILDREGFTLSDLLNATCLDVVRRNLIPINLRSKMHNHFVKENEITIALIKKELERIVKKQGKGHVKKVYLFGSFARGEERLLSDIDLRIEGDDELRFIDIANIRLDLKESTGREVDLIAEKPNNLDPQFYNIIRKEEICIYEAQ